MVLGPLLGLAGSVMSALAQEQAAMDRAWLAYCDWQRRQRYKVGPWVFAGDGKRLPVLRVVKGGR